MPAGFRACSWGRARKSPRGSRSRKKTGSRGRAGSPRRPHPGDSPQTWEDGEVLASQSRAPPAPRCAELDSHPVLAAVFVSGFDRVEFRSFSFLAGGAASAPFPKRTAPRARPPLAPEACGSQRPCSWGSFRGPAPGLAPGDVALSRALVDVDLGHGLRCVCRPPRCTCRISLMTLVTA